MGCSCTAPRVGLSSRICLTGGVGVGCPEFWTGSGAGVALLGGVVSTGEGAGEVVGVGEVGVGVGDVTGEALGLGVGVTAGLTGVLVVGFGLSEGVTIGFGVGVELPEVGATTLPVGVVGVTGVEPLGVVLLGEGVEPELIGVEVPGVVELPVAGVVPELVGVVPGVVEPDEGVEFVVPLEPLGVVEGGVPVVEFPGVVVLPVEVVGGVVPVLPVGGAEVLGVVVLLGGVVPVVVVPVLPVEVLEVVGV